MEDSSKKSESQNAETLPPPYEGEMQEIKLTEPTYPGVVQGLGNDVPSHSGGVPQSRSREAVRDFPGARQASSQAKFWSFAGFFTGLVILVGVILVVVFTT
ncbi:hypothetical protein HOLleu_02524 [Holothuria leucospilota]|uniref:Uncharacterized protein n=1 Tax=Holothuria leucospilota TaxID=206669 RepID=A0A9Q1HLG8_HOLLE|nr:hypothetical protein HOLleu_02524 [Holothuria leucospilota]